MVRIQQIQIWVVLKKVWEPLLYELNFNLFLIKFCYSHIIAYMRSIVFTVL